MNLVAPRNSAALLQRGGGDAPLQRHAPARRPNARVSSSWESDGIWRRPASFETIPSVLGLPLAPGPPRPAPRRPAGTMSGSLPAQRVTRLYWMREVASRSLRSLSMALRPTGARGVVQDGGPCGTGKSHAPALRRTTVVADWGHRIQPTTGLYDAVDTGPRHRRAGHRQPLWKTPAKRSRRRLPLRR